VAISAGATLRAMTKSDGSAGCRKDMAVCVEHVVEVQDVAPADEGAGGGLEQLGVGHGSLSLVSVVVLSLW
jgi:hypothetical protein